MPNLQDLSTFIKKNNIKYEVVNGDINIDILGLNMAIWPNTKPQAFNDKMKKLASTSNNGMKYIPLEKLKKILEKERSSIAKTFHVNLKTFTTDIFLKLLDAQTTSDDIDGDGDTYNINGIELIRIEKYKDKWSCGKVVANILGYSKYNDVIASLGDEYKCYFYYLNNDLLTHSNGSEDHYKRDDECSPEFNTSDIIDKKFAPNDKAIYLNNEGVLHLMSVSQKQVAKEIRADMEKIYGKIVLAGECTVNGEVVEPKKTCFTMPLTRGRKATPKATKVGDNEVSPRIRSKSRDNLMKNISTIKAGLYFLEINYENEQGDTLYKCGHTKDITTRLNDHETNFGNYTVLHFEPVMASHIAEDAMFDMLKRLGMLQPTQDVDGLSKRELIILGEHTKDDVIEIMGKAAKSTIIDKDILLSMEETTRVKIQEESKITQEEIKLKSKEQDTKQAEFNYNTRQLDIQLANMTHK